MPRKILGKNVVRLRSLAGYTQEELAEKAEMDRRYIQRIEAGTANPSIDILWRLKKSFRCSWDTLFKV